MQRMIHVYIHVYTHFAHEQLMKAHDKEFYSVSEKNNFVKKLYPGVTVKKFKENQG